MTETSTHNRDKAMIALGAIRGRFANLTTTDTHDGDGRYELVFPAQNGVKFEIILYLDGDVLNLCAGGFWGEWFPCTDDTVVSSFIEAAVGLLEGSLRIVEYTSSGEVLKACLQRRSKDRWYDIYKYCDRMRWPWTRTEQRVLQNM